MQDFDPHYPTAHLTVAGRTVTPGTRRRFSIPVSTMPLHAQLHIPIEVVHGKAPGPRIFICSTIHGDELNGIEIIREVLGYLKPRSLRGAVIAAPIVNIFGFISQSRYLPDRRDLNRSFPGSKKGSLAARVAALFMQEVVVQCSHGIDLHTGSSYRNNLPQIRADLSDREALRCAEAFASPVIIHSSLRDGSIRESASKRGVHALVYEAGETNRFDDASIAIGVRGVLNVLHALGMIAKPRPRGMARISRTFRKGSAGVIYTNTSWIRAKRSGLFRNEIKLGTQLQKGDVVGFVADAFGERRSDLLSPRDGVVIGLSHSPVVNRGDALIHLASDPYGT